jgi:hypothetical protein
MLEVGWTKVEMLMVLYLNWTVEGWVVMDGETKIEMTMVP